MSPEQEASLNDSRYTAEACQTNDGDVMTTNRGEDYSVVSKQDTFLKPVKSRNNHINDAGYTSTGTLTWPNKLKVLSFIPFFLIQARVWLLYST